MTLTSDEPDLSRLHPSALLVLLDLARYRLMTTDQIARLRYRGKSAGWVRKQLSDLKSAGLVASVARRRVAVSADDPTRRTNKHFVWYATEKGVELVGTFPEAKDESLKAIDPRRATVNTQHHTLGVTEIGVQVAEAVGDPDVVRWTPEFSHNLGGHGQPRVWLRGDSLITVEYGAPGAEMPLPIFLEYDRGTASMVSNSRSPGVVDKIRLYLDYRRMVHGGRPAWSSTYLQRPLSEHRTAGYPYLWWVIEGADQWATHRRDQIITLVNDRSVFGVAAPKDDELVLIVSTLSDVQRLTPLGAHGRNLDGEPVNFLGSVTQRGDCVSPVVASVVTDRPGLREGNPDA